MSILSEPIKFHDKCRNKIGMSILYQGKIASLSKPFIQWSELHIVSKSVVFSVVSQLTILCLYLQ